MLLADIPFFTGDFNSPGVTCDSVDTRLTAALACCSLKIVNEGPTRLNYDGGQNKLDVMIETDDGGHLCDVSTVSTGFSAHCLLKARLNCGRERTLVTFYSYRDIKNMDIDSFRASSRSSLSFTNPPTDPDDMPQHIMWPSTANTNRNLDPQCS